MDTNLSEQIEIAVERYLDGWSLDDLMIYAYDNLVFYYTNAVSDIDELNEFLDAYGVK